MTIQRPLTQHQRTVERTLQLHRPFSDDWYKYASRFLSCGFANPQRLRRFAEATGIGPEFMPDATAAGVFEFLCELGSEDLVCHKELIVDAIVAHFGFNRKDLLELCYAWGGGEVGLEEFGRQAWDHGMRWHLSRQSQTFLNDPRPIGVVARELLEEVACV